MVVLNSSVQLMATVSISGVLADEKRRVAVRRFADARKPPTGESRASGGPSTPAATRATIGPRQPTATTRKSAVISDVAAAVVRRAGGGRDGEQRRRAGEREQSADHAPGAEQPRLDRGVGQRAGRRHPRGAPSGGEHGEQRGDDAAADGRRDRQPAGADGEVRRGDAVAHEPVGERSAEDRSRARSRPAEPTRPTIAASHAIMRRIWPGVAATARRSAISRSRCWIDRPIVLATTKMAMNSASPPNDAVTAISVVRACWSSG